MVSPAWGVVGAAMACYAEALAYARERLMFGGPIARYQMVQDKLVFMRPGFNLDLDRSRLRFDGILDDVHQMQR